MPPSKRPRIETEENTTDEQPPAPERSSRFWLKDGNIVLQAERTLYRVHGSMLARHSKVFEDMFDIPQPPEPEGPLAEGCPVVSLSDSAKDLEELLSVFYDNAKAFDKTCIPRPLLTSLLRLGKKYQIDYLFNAAHEAFKKDYPVALAIWNPHDGVVIEEDENYSLYRQRLIKLAHELSFTTVLPSLYLDYVTDSSLGDIIREQNLDASDPGLNADTRETLAVGRDRLLLHLKERYGHYLKLILKNDPPFFTNCRDIAKCKPKRLTTFDALTLWQVEEGILGHKLDAWEDPDNLTLCSPCIANIQTMFERVREDTWAKLPGFFGLGNWEDLKDELL